MNLSGKRILVTGGGGFIGSHLCRRLIDNGADVYVTVKYNSPIDNVRLVGIWDQLTPIESDIRNPDSLKILKNIRPEIIYHLAAYNHVGDSFTQVAEAIDANGKGTVNLLEAYDDYERFIYISSSEVYGYQKVVPFSEDVTPSPLSPYSVGKYMGELYSRMRWHSMNNPIVVLRPFNAFGPYQSARAIISETIIKCLKGEDIITTEGLQTREFNFVANLIDGFILAGQKSSAVGKIINLGCGSEISIRDLVLKIHSVTNSKSVLRIGELDTRPGEIWRMYADNRLARELLEWHPKVSLTEGLQITCEWFARYLNEFSNSNSGLFRLSS